MKRPLRGLLWRFLRRELLRRLLLWGGCALTAMTVGGAVSRLMEEPHVLRLATSMVIVSCLPLFLLWPLSEQRFLVRLRRLDDEMVFEALLEAQPGPIRELLRQRADQHAAALALDEPPHDPLLAGIRGVLAALVIGPLLAEACSLLIFSQSIVLPSAAAASQERGRRLEEPSFSEFATEDPVLRRSRQREAERRNAVPGENPRLGSPDVRPNASRNAMRGAHAQGGTTQGEDAASREAIAKRKQGELEEDAPPTGATSPQGPTPGEGHRTEGDTAEAPRTARLPERAPSQGPQGQPALPGRTGQGYEHTGDTKVPSPLRDYRAQFEARFAERTGRRLAASPRMRLGDLRDFQRHYFETFTLRAEIGPADDPYLAQLKRRWAERKGGSW